MEENNNGNLNTNISSEENLQLHKDTSIGMDGNTSDTIEVNIPFVSNLVGWATFKAVIEIIFGALSCLGIITAVYGIPQIIAGVKLFKAVDEIKNYMATGELNKIGDAMYGFNKYFKLSGISVIIKIVVMIILIILYAAVLVMIFQNSGDIFNNLPYNY